MGRFRPSYIFISSGIFITKMTRYYIPLRSADLMRVKLSLKWHMNIVQNLLSIALPSLFIITFKVSSSFFNLALNTLFFASFFTCYLFVQSLSTVQKKDLFSISLITSQTAIYLYHTFFVYFCNIVSMSISIYLSVSLSISPLSLSLSTYIYINI